MQLLQYSETAPGTRDMAVWKLCILILCSLDWLAGLGQDITSLQSAQELCEESSKYLCHQARPCWITTRRS
jgi:hypothetical protein